MLLPAFVSAPEPGAVYHVDALTLLGAMADNSVDAIVTDPPYGIGYSSHKALLCDNKFGADVMDASWLGEAYRVAAADACLYVCTRWDVASAWAEAINAAGWRVKQRIVWDKGNWTGGDLDYYASQTEDILFAVKGRPQLQTRSRPSNVWLVRRATRHNTRAVVDPYTKKDDHPTMKPVGLMERMIADSTQPGALVVDPFAGSGTTLVAAQNLGRRYIGCDIVSKYVDQARRRLAEPYMVDMFEAVGD